MKVKFEEVKSNFLNIEMLAQTSEGILVVTVSSEDLQALLMMHRKMRCRFLVSDYCKD